MKHIAWMGMLACRVALAPHNDVDVSCSVTDECPLDLVCVADLGQCQRRDNPCIQADGAQYRAIVAGTPCRDGVCIAGRCAASTCGDGYVDKEGRKEACDDGPLNSDFVPNACRADCTFARCGDGVIDFLSNEACDDGAGNGEGAVCSTECTRGCGDGHLQEGEGCDDGNRVSDDGCDANCTVTACGNGIRTSAETCDDGNAVNGDGCDDNCRATECGNNRVTAGEECDDGNFIDGLSGNAPGADHCDHDCTVSRCGNGVISIASGEQCDDGNSMAGDGCSDTCVIERGFVCGNVPSQCAQLCGDGFVASGEQCDDRGTSAGDGCDDHCHIEAGWGCGGDPSVCTPTWYVNASAATGGDGLSWTTAFKSLQSAIAQANAKILERPTQDIWVAQGTYRPAGANGNREATFTSLQDVRWLGGFAGGETRREARDPVAHPTVLSGDLNGNDGAAFSNRADNSCHVVTVDRMAADSPLNTTQEIDGFTIQDGEADANAGPSCTVTQGPTFAAGGGLLMSGRAVLRNLLFQNNRAIGTGSEGGGLYVIGRNTATRIFDSRFENNRAANGAGAVFEQTGISNEYDAALIQGCAFEGNVATTNGGAIFGVQLIIFNSTFRNNQATVGGAIWGTFPVLSVNPGESVLLNVLFDHNTAVNNGGYYWYTGGGAHTVHCLHCTLIDSPVEVNGFSLTASFRRSILHNSHVTIDTNNFAVADNSFINPTTGVTGATNVVAADPNLDSAGVPNAGSPVLNRAVLALPQVQVIDVCDLDHDNDRHPVKTYDFAKDPCDLDGDHVTNEPLPVDHDGNPRANGAPDLGAIER